MEGADDAEAEVLGVEDGVTVVNVVVAVDVVQMWVSPKLLTVCVQGGGGGDWAWGRGVECALTRRLAGAMVLSKGGEAGGIASGWFAMAACSIVQRWGRAWRRGSMAARSRRRSARREGGGEGGAVGGTEAEGDMGGAGGGEEEGGCCWRRWWCCR